MNMFSQKARSNYLLKISFPFVLTLVYSTVYFIL